MRYLKQHDIPTAVDIIAEASREDPYWVYLEPNPTSRIHILRKFLTVDLHLEWAKGYLMGVGRPLQGIAVWSPPVPTKNPRIPLILAFLKYLRLLSSSFIGLALKAIKVLWRYRTLRVKYAVRPYYHLILIGVATSSQGKGLASKLIRPILKQADKEGVGAYVETTNPLNVTLYEHFGFELKEGFSIPNSSLKGWGFYRSPKDPLNNE